MNKTVKSFVSAAAVAAALSFGVSAAQAASVNHSTACIGGQVPGYDWAELTSSYKESIWDRRAAMQLTSENTKVTLSVTDDLGNSVCEDVANMTATCRFSFTDSFTGTFNIRVDNTQHNADTRYTLCAE